MMEFKKNDLFYIPDEVVRKSLTIQEGIKIVEDIYKEYGKGAVRKCFHALNILIYQQFFKVLSAS